jgi:prolyl 4-hydroxylase
MAGWLNKALAFWAGIGVALFAVSIPRLRPLLTYDLDLSLPSPLSNIPIFRPSQVSPDTFVCHPQNYTTELISVDPLVIYIHDFLNPHDIDGLLRASEGLFKPSTVTKYGRTVQAQYRTSWSASLPRTHPVVGCVLSRASAFMGTMLAPGKDDIGAPQLVRYRPGQKFDLHTDWYPRPQQMYEGKPRLWNRIASFFAILQANCTEGETWFPHIRAIAPQDRRDPRGVAWREHEKEGLAFRPIVGNALFWVNLHANGTGDERVEHAGLPVKEGMKTAMNIWPRVFMGDDPWEDDPEPLDLAS